MCFLALAQEPDWPKLMDRSTTPQDFCHLACGLFQQAIAATASGQIDLDTLHSGLSYFCQPLLSWSLGGIVTWLGSEIHRQG